MHPNTYFRQAALLGHGFPEQGNCLHFEEKPFSGVGRPLRGPQEGVTPRNVVKIPSSAYKTRSRRLPGVKDGYSQDK